MSDKCVFAVVAHPDDIEFLMAGTLIRLREAGYEIHYMNVANGCCGSMQYSREETAKLRRKESIAACELLGATYHESLCDDLDIFFDRPTLAALSAEMRIAKPNIVLTHSPADYMEDHMNACRLAVTAAFVRGMPNFPTEPSVDATDQQVAVYHTQPYSNRDPLTNIVTPDIFIDTSDLITRKQQQLACHASQKEWLDVTQGQDSYLKTIENLDQEVGQMSERFEYAEGWRRHLHFGYSDAGYDPLCEDLPDQFVSFNNVDTS